jgi:hypothetical protein
MLMNRLTLTKKKMLISVIAMCIVAISGVTLWLNTRPVAQAAVLNPHPGLLGWWSFNDTAADSSGYGNNATIYGATWVAGRSQSYALSFNGINNYVLSPNIALGSSLTLSAWVDVASFSSQVATIVGQNNPNYLLNIYEQGNSFGAYVFGDVIATYSGVTTNTWYNVALTLNITAYTGSSTTVAYAFYVNGVLVASGSHTNTYWSEPTFGNYPIDVGAWPAISYGYANATIDEVHLYNRVLSLAEIQAGFQQSPYVSVNLLAQVPKGTTQVITTLSWQGTGSINVTIVPPPPSQSYNESNPSVSEYQKTDYSTTSTGLTTMLNIKRISVTVSALSSAQNWYIELTLNNVGAYQISVEVQS